MKCVRMSQKGKAKLKMQRSKSERLKQRMRDEYNEKDRELKRCAREDKRKCMEVAVKAADNSRSDELYNIIKT